MLLASLLFASMGVCIKLSSAYFNAAELLFYRGIVGIIFMAALLRVQGQSLRTPVPGLHIKRSLLGVVSLGAWFYAIAHLPLATAMTLNYMSSIWLAVFLVAGVWMTPKLRATGPTLRAQVPLLLTVIAGFAGVVMMLRPTIEQNQGLAGLVGLLSGVGSALAYLQILALTRAGEPEGRTVYIFAVISTVSGGLAMAVTGLSDWDWRGAVWLIPMGLLASLGQLCMTRAFGTGANQRATLMVANLQYSGIVFSAVYSLLVFGDAIPWLGWAGMATIVVSGIAATVLRDRAVTGTQGLARDARPAQR
ncbi:MAG: DMT family transporter [Burkholderiaceae bacterium]|nr:DMT family transporter [Burkholderiaceae bacterium]MDO9089873.1 DMT family transporter [Burkholderiaceae bacterium]